MFNILTLGSILSKHVGVVQKVISPCVKELIITTLVPPRGTLI